MPKISSTLRPLLAVVLVCSWVHEALGASVSSDTLQPDVFGTGTALQQRTRALNDPLTRQCGLPSGGGLSLAAAVDLGLCRNPTTRAAWAAAHEQAAALGSAESTWLPQIGATGGESRFFGSHVDVTGTVDSHSQDTADAAVNLSWLLYDFGGRSSRTRSARYLLDAAAANVDSVAQQTVFAVVQTYYGVVAGDAGLVAARTTEGTAARSLDVARSLREGGVATLADVLQAETAYNQAVLTRVEAERTARSAHGALAVAIGITADQPLKLDAEPVPTEVPTLTARMTDLMTEATRQRPDLAAAQAQQDAAVADVTAARAVGRPSISLSASRNWVNTSGIPRESYGVVGLNVTVPIFTGFSVAYGVRQAQAALEAREVNAEQVRLNVSLDVWNAYYALDSGNQELAQTAILIKTAENNQEVALGRYRSGVGTIIDLLTAQSSAATARQLRVNAEQSWQVARAQLALALGRLSGAEPLSALSRP